MMMLTMVPAMTVISVMITIVTHASERKMTTGKKVPCVYMVAI